MNHLSPAIVQLSDPSHRLTVAMLAARMTFAKLRQDGTLRRNRCYSTVADAMAELEQPLRENGLVVIFQDKTESVDMVRMSSILVHASGQWVANGEVRLPCPAWQDLAATKDRAKLLGMSGLLGFSPDTAAPG